MTVLFPLNPCYMILHTVKKNNNNNKTLKHGAVYSKQSGNICDFCFELLTVGFPVVPFLELLYFILELFMLSLQSPLVGYTMVGYCELQGACHQFDCKMFKQFESTDIQKNMNR